MEKTLLEQVQEHIKEKGQLNLPFYRMYDVVKSTVSACGLEGKKPDYTWIELMKTLHCVINVFAELNIKYELPEFEKESKDEETTYDYYSSYDELKPIYDELYFRSNLSLIDDLLQKEIELSEKQYLRQGILEGNFSELIVKATETLDTVNNMVKDEKKLVKFISTLDKKAPNITGVIKQLTDSLPKLTSMINGFTNKESK